MDIPVDAHGFVLSRATHLPGGSHTAYTRRCTTSRQTSSSRSARRGRPRAAARATRHLRASALPPAALVAAPGQGKPAIIPDAFVRASLPAALTSSVDRPSRHQTCLGLDRRRVAAISSPPIPAPTRWRHGQRSRSYSGDQQRPIGNALFVFSRLEVDPTILRYFGMHHRIRLDSYLDPSLEFLRTPKHWGRSRMDGSMAGAFSLGTHYSLVVISKLGRVDR